MKNKQRIALVLAALMMTTSSTPEALLTSYAAENNQTMASETQDDNLSNDTSQSTQEDAENLEYLNKVKDSFSYGSLSPVYGTDTNAIDFFKSKIEAKGYEGVEVSIENTEYTSTSEVLKDYASIAGDGTINYLNYDLENYSKMNNQKYAGINVTFKLKKGNAQTTLVKQVNVKWDEDKVKEQLTSKIADKITEDDIKGDNENLDEVKENLKLPNSVSGAGFADITWTSSNKNVIAITGYSWDDFSKGTITQPDEDTDVTLTANIKFNKTDYSDKEISIEKKFVVTVKAIDKAGVLAQMQEKLDTYYPESCVTDFNTGSKMDKDAITGDFNFPSLKKSKMPDSSGYKISFTSTDTTVNGFHVNIMRPLPGEESKVVTVTAKLEDRNNKELYVTKDLKFTIKPITSEEIDEQAALIEKIKADLKTGLLGTNTDAENITTNLATIYSGSYDSEGNVNWAKNKNQSSGIGVKVESFKSDNEDIIASGTLKYVATPKYNTNVTVSALLSSELFEKYAIAYPDNKDFAKLYQQEVTTTFKVTGTDGEKQADEPNAADVEYLKNVQDSFGYGAFTPEYGTDTNIVEFINKKIKSKGFEDVGVEFISASIDNTSSALENYSGIEANGDLKYLNYDLNNKPSSFWQKIAYWNANFKLTYKTATAEFTKRVNLNWDEEKIKDQLKTNAADKVTEDTIKGNNESLDTVKEDMKLPVAIDGASYVDVKWTSSDSDVIAIKEASGYGATSCDAKVSRPTEDKTVKLTATFKFTQTDYGSKDITITKDFDVTVKAVNAQEIMAEMQKQLDDNYTTDKLKGFYSGNAINADAVDEDILFVSGRKTGVDNYSDYTFEVLSDSDNVEISGYRASIYRPLVGQEATKAKITIKMTNKNNKALSVTKDFEFTLKPIEQSELDAAAKLMNAAKEDYKNALLGENEDIDHITKNMKRFFEVRYDESGNLYYARTKSNEIGTGIILDELNTTDPLNTGHYFDTSDTTILGTNSLVLVSTPKYNTKVTINSLLTSGEFGKYAKKYPENEDFAKLYRQPVSVDVTVLGTDGEDPNLEKQDIQVKFALSGDTLHKDGPHDAYLWWITQTEVTVKEDDTVMELLKKILADNNYTFEGSDSYISSITTPEGLKLAEKDNGEMSGWMYSVNGEIPGVYANQYKLKAGDVVQWFYSDDGKAVEVPEKQEEPDAADVEYLNNVVSKFAYGTFTPVYGKDTNICEYLKNEIESKGFEGVEVKLASANVAGSSVSIADCAGIAKNGDITYLNYDLNNKPGMFWQKTAYWEANFELIYKTAKTDLKKQINIPWDIDKVKAQVKTNVVDKVTPDSIKGENDSLDKVTTDITLPIRFNDASYVTVQWESSDESVIAIETPTGVLPTTCNAKVSRTDVDKTVKLTATFTFIQTESDAEAITLTKDYDVTVSRIDTKEILEEMQKKLDDNYTMEKLTNFYAGTPLVADAVDDDIQLLTSRKTGISGNYKYEAIANTDNLEVFGYRISVYRPLPGEEAQKASFTIKMTDKDNTALSVTKTFNLTLKPIAQSEIDETIRLMEAAKKDYSNAILGENSDINHIEKDMRSFQEVRFGENGNLFYARNYKEKIGNGIILDELNPDVPLDSGHYFDTSNDAIIGENSLKLYKTPQYNTVINIKSLLTSGEFGKYAKKYPENEDFAKLYRQPVSVDVLVLGTDGEDPGTEKQDINVSFGIYGNKKLGEGSYSKLETWFTNANVTVKEGTTVMELLKKMLEANHYTYEGSSNYISAITTPDGYRLAEFDEGEMSGWMYTVNGVLADVYANAYTLKNGDVVSWFYSPNGTVEELPQENNDETEAKAVDALIEAIGNVTYTAESKALIEAARSAYEKLTEAQKALVSKLETLETAEKAYEKLEEEAKDKESAKAVDELIEKIGEVKATAESKALIEAARSAYEKLTEAQKALVSKLETLETSEKTYDELTHVADLTLKKTSASLYEGATTKIIPLVAPDTAIEKGVIYTSSNEKIATVDANGLVKAVKVGTAVITVTTIDGNKAAEFKVTVKAASIKLNAKKVTLYTKTLTKKKLKASVRGLSKKVKWKSSNSKVAKVDSNGVIKALKAGKTTITAICNGKKASCVVNVLAPVLKVNKKSATIKKGKTLTLKTTVTPSATIKWVSTNKKVATVNSKGVVKGIRSGKAIIKITANGITKTVKITVK
ncbi:Ig-like domain (group 2) [Acetitomaculum ruminis DSM 5522]|uniref:Ig-like domain (Group 2) n=1 Tax=Acetitomaculum ruminis DSM 5522 TaxID=1120918 RepID=A0A1I0YZJ0_9FIRM|nr:DUF4430 domain-containing protein [Acetitomaculum ruminis]SFB18592.1 Ig-like domain (group 2) [Acetitomaculum ruminis DSM 5522]